MQEEWSRALVNTWTDEEEQIFIEKLADFASRPEKDGLKKNFRALLSLSLSVAVCRYLFLVVPGILLVMSVIGCPDVLVSLAAPRF